ncbi:hypothetical protein KCU93_g8121, partial [Aureobasidium melanogenum]
MSDTTLSSYHSESVLGAAMDKGALDSHWNSDMMYFLDDLLLTPGHASRRTRQANESSTGLGSSASVDCGLMSQVTLRYFQGGLNKLKIDKLERQAVKLVKVNIEHSKGVDELETLIEHQQDNLDELESHLVMKTSSSTSSIPPSTITSSSRLVSSSALGTNSTTQISSSTDSSSTIDGLPTIAASSIPVPEFTSTSISCNDVACVRFAIGASTISVLGAAATDLAVTPTADTASVPEFTATTISCDPLMSLLCVSLAIGPSTTSIIGTAAPDGSDPTGSPVQFTATETSATSSSVPTTTTSTSSACTPLATSCGSNGYFPLMAVSNDSSINGQYALVNGVSIGMYGDYSNAQGFCLDSNNALVWAVTDGYAAVKSSSSGPIQIETQGNPLSCTAVPNEDCTATLQCTWYNDFRMVVDKSNYNTVYLTDGMDEDYGGSSNPVPVTLIMQSW